MFDTAQCVLCSVYFSAQPNKLKCVENIFFHIYVDSAAVSVDVVILVELTNTVFVNSTNITTNIETAMLSTFLWFSNSRDFP